MYLIRFQMFSRMLYGYCRVIRNMLGCPMALNDCDRCPLGLSICSMNSHVLEIIVSWSASYLLVCVCSFSVVFQRPWPWCWWVSMTCKEVPRVWNNGLQDAVVLKGVAGYWKAFQWFCNGVQLMSCWYLRLGNDSASMFHVVQRCSTLSNKCSMIV